VLPFYALAQARAAESGARGSQQLAALLATAYVLYLPLHYIHMADFHPSALMVPLLIAAWRAKALSRWRWYYVWLLLSLCCRVDAAFAAMALGLVIAFGPKEHRMHGVYTLALASAWLAIDLAIWRRRGWRSIWRSWFLPSAACTVLERAVWSRAALARWEAVRWT
jgi:hypothetical protein